jgi:hypothetical protein
MTDEPKTTDAAKGKYDDELAKAKTSELVNYLAHPAALQERFPPTSPPKNPFGFTVPANEQQHALAWRETVTEFVIAVAAELDRRVPARDSGS